MDIDDVLNQEDDVEFNLHDEDLINIILKEALDGEFVADPLEERLQPFPDFKPFFTPDLPEEHTEARLEAILYGDSETEQYFLPSKVDPLALVHQQELVLAKKTDKKLKRPLLSRREFTEKKPPTVYCEELKSLTRKINSKKEIPACSLSVSSKFILLGNKDGQVILFEHGGEEVKKLDIKRTEFGAVTCIDISYDEQLCVVGYEFGQIAVWEVSSATCLRASNSLFTEAVVDVCFFKLSHANIISCDASGKVQHIEFSRSMFSSSFKTNQLSLKGLYFCPLFEAKLLTGVTSLLAICSVDAVYLYKTDTELDSFWACPQPISNSVPCVSWTYSQPAVLAVAWHKSLSLYRITGTLQEHIEILSVCYFSTAIKYLGCMYPETMLGIFKTGHLWISRLPDLLKANKETLSKLESPGTKEIMNDSFYSSVKTLNRSVFMLCKSEFSVCKLLGWKQCLQTLIRNKDWFDAMSFGLDVYQHKIDVLYGVYTPDTQDFLRDMIIEYVKNVNFHLESKIANTIEFCIGIESTDMLFEDFFEFIVDKGDGKGTLGVFMDTLEPHILSGNFRSVPTHALGKVIGYYLMVNRPAVIERIILNLDPSTLDPQQIVPIFEDNDLLTGLVFLYTQTDKKDFVSPLNAIYSYMMKQPEKAKVAYKLLWYVRLCFKGETFPTGRIPEYHYPRAVISLLNTLIAKPAPKNERIIKSMLKIDSSVTLEVLGEVFWGVGERILDFEYEGAPSKEEMLAVLEEEFTDLPIRPLTLFVSQLKDINIISKTLCLKSAKELMKPSRVVNYDSFPRMNSIESYVENGPDNFHIEPELPAGKKTELVLKLVKAHELTKPEIASLLKVSKQNNFTEVLIYMHELREEYNECIRNFIRCEDENVRKSIFDWLSSILQKIGDEQFKSIKREVMDCLNVLVEINSDRTAKIVKEWYKAGHEKIINKLNNAPGLQLKYLGELIRNTDEYELDETIILKYIDLMCRYSPDEVLAFIKEFTNYPIEKTLEICKKWEILKAESYLYETLGDANQALQIYVKIINDKRGRVPIDSGKIDNDIKELHAEVEEAYQLCKRNANGLDEIDNISIWFPLMAIILDIYQEYCKKIIFHKVEPFIVNSIHKALEGMVEYIQFDKVIAFLDKGFAQVPFKYIKETFIGVLSRHSYQNNILKTAINLLNEDIKVTTQDLYQIRKKGFNSQELVCSHCKGTVTDAIKVSSARIVVFVCGHIYHASCIKTSTCPLCTQEMLKTGKV